MDRKKATGPHEALFARAKKVIPGGVNSPVRAFNGVGGTPVFAESGKGARIRTADGRTLAQGCLAWIWARGENTVPVPGFRTERQAGDNAAALEKGPLTDAQMAQIEAALDRA